MKYIIGSGWWCSPEKDTREKLYGDEFIRGQAFHNEWIHSIKAYTSPEKIYIVDSNSPIIPEVDKNIVFVSLNENGGHSTNLKGKYSGWMRSVIHSMSYAQNCDCQYYVYVEQDVLLYGKGIIEHCINNMKKPYAFGKCNDFNNPLQQSFFIVKKDAIDKFLARIYLIDFDDSRISPEKKFALATSPLFTFIPKFIFASPKNKLLKKILWRIQNKLSAFLGSYDYLIVGYGRDRPINMGDDFFYFQHGNESELKKYSNLD
ncbi:hypothetical protein [Siccibacter turicensis]|uniref:hypothetical protein n=1 Tax=Siccibacter turicensis TaxID=357233 RepID=UPI001021BBA4|nr:hypothetical protein [Siccibacter turicensis]